MLETQRLYMKPMKQDDAYHLFTLNSDPEVMKYTGDVASSNLAEVQRLLNDIILPQYQKYKMGRFATFLKDGTFIGWCGLKYFPETGEVDLGYRLMKKFWGQGYATEASMAALKYGFEELHLPKILARAMPQNMASIKVLQKLHMTYKGMFNDPGYPHGFVLYELTREEFEKCKS